MNVCSLYSGAISETSVIARTELGDLGVVGCLFHDLPVEPSLADTSSAVFYASTDLILTASSGPGLSALAFLLLKILLLRRKFEN